MHYWRAHLALFFVNVLYAASHVLAKGVMPTYLEPSVFILLRVLGATSLFWFIKLFLKKEWIAKRDLPLVALCGFFGVAANQLFFFHGLNLSSSINSGIIMTINPILVVMLAFFILKEKITATKITGILLGALGAILLTLDGNSGKGDSSLGDFYLFLNAASYAIYLVIAKPLMQKYSPFTVITYTFSFGLLYVIIFPPTLSSLVLTNFYSIPIEIWYKIIFVIVGVTFLVYLLTMYGLKYLSPSVSSAYIYLQPILVIFFALIFAYFQLADDYSGTITSKKVVYMICIFLGVWLTSYKKN